MGAFIGVLSLKSAGNRAVDTPRGRIWVEKDEATLFDRVAQELPPGGRVAVFPEINAVDALFEARASRPS